MNADKISIRRRIGRPPAGAKHGERVRDYPQLSLRVPMEIRAMLQALRIVTGLPQWRVIIRALDCYFRQLSHKDQRLVIDVRSQLLKAR